MQYIDRNAKNMVLSLDFGINPDNQVLIYPCIHCGRDTKVIQNRVIYCIMCQVASIHPRYDWNTDRLYEAQKR